MSKGYGFVIGLSAIVMFGVATVSWDRLEAKEEAFAKQCNEQGKVAVYRSRILQCVDKEAA